MFAYAILFFAVCVIIMQTFHSSNHVHTNEYLFCFVFNCDTFLWDHA